jgi:hypothetical protein
MPYAFSPWTEEDLRPVLRVGAARRGLDRDDGVAGVVFPGEERVLLEAVELALQRSDALAHLVELAVVGREPDQLAEVARLAGQRLVAVAPSRQARVLRGDSCRPLLVVPEAGHPHRFLELAQPGAQRVRVKGNHGPSRAGP